MKKVILFILSCLFLVACSKKSSDSTTSEFSNSLTFGTGLNQANLFQLTGTGTTFPKSTPIYFRLESQDDNAGSPVRIIISKGDGTLYTLFDFTNPQSYGHIFLSNFSIPDAGNYTATGILKTGNKIIATSPLTIQ